MLWGCVPARTAASLQTKAKRAGRDDLPFAVIGTPPCTATSAYALKFNKRLRIYPFGNTPAGGSTSSTGWRVRNRPRCPSSPNRQNAPARALCGRPVRRAGAAARRPCGGLRPRPGRAGLRGAGAGWTPASGVPWQSCALHIRAGGLAARMEDGRGTGGAAGGVGAAAGGSG